MSKVVADRNAPPPGKRNLLRLSSGGGSGAMFLGRCAIVGLLLVVWQAVSGRLVSEVWISSPDKIAVVIAKWVADGSLVLHLSSTLSAMGLGLLIGSVAGVASGIGLGLLPMVERLLSPLIVALYALPKTALAPLLVILLGIGIESTIALVCVTVYFILLFSTLDGIRNIDRDWVENMRLMGANSMEITRKLLLPGSLSWIFGGLRISVRLAFAAALVGEMISSNRGVGFLIEYSAAKYDSTSVMAAVVVVVVLSVVFTELLTFVESSIGPKVR